MANRSGETQGISTEWVMEVFDWDTDYPENSFLGMDNEADKRAYANIDLILSFSSKGGSATDVLKKLAKFGGAQGISAANSFTDNYDASNVSNGLVSLSFARSKAKVSGPCSATVVGPLPGHTRIGNWVMISMLSNTTAGGLKYITRFIGQIHTINTKYSTTENGAIVQVSTINIREWSSLLEMPVKFDISSFSQTENSIQLMTVAEAIQGSLTGATSYETLKESVSQILNSYTAAQVFLALVGCMNNNNMPNELKENGTSSFKVGLRLPEMPQSLIDRLQMKNVSQKTAFQDGFVTVISGIQTESSGNFDNGVFLSSSDNLRSAAAALMGGGSFLENSNGVTEYQKIFNKDENHKLLPNSASLKTLSQIGNVTIWKMIEDYCDPNLNEMFTDIYYTETTGGSNATIVAQPVVVVRAKPYRTDAAESILGSDLITNNIYKSFPKYEDVPTVEISQSLIVDMSISNTINDSPTYFSAGCNGQVDSSEDAQQNAISTIKAVKHVAEMDRFGGNWKVMSSDYFAGVDALDWQDARIALGRVWYGLDYRTPSGSLVIKDSGLPISVGFNLSWTLPIVPSDRKESLPGLTSAMNMLKKPNNDENFIKVVVQVESISTTFRVNPDGSRSTQTTIGFSRMMGVGLEGNLYFLPSAAFGNIFNTPLAEEATKAPLISGIGDFAKSLEGFV
jgi:hypothetical protein